jgi:hypothetical protein
MVSMVVASACLTVLQWLLWGTAALFAVLVVVQAVRGDADAQPFTGVLAGLVFLGLGWLSGAAARRIAAR